MPSSTTCRRQQSVRHYWGRAHSCPGLMHLTCVMHRTRAAALQVCEQTSIVVQTTSRYWMASTKILAWAAQGPQQRWSHPRRCTPVGTSFLHQGALVIRKLN